ncbi:MAG: hypothetical protein F6J92_03520 [Symploca sp. SIO1A3]|nr:hypothetical protein [Symploca sp. SIO1A3]
MLLAQLTESLQQQFNQLQVQIEQLQEQQRLIQAQLQRVGSVESKMESAAVLVQEAIAEINDVCPEELDNYQQTVNSLFTNVTAQLPSSDDDDFVDPEESLTEGDYFEGEQSNGNGNGHHDATQFDLIVEVESQEVDQVTSEAEELLYSLKWQELLRIASEHGINTKGLKKDVLINALIPILQENGDPVTG